MLCAFCFNRIDEKEQRCWACGKSRIDSEMRRSVGAIELLPDKYLTVVLPTNFTGKLMLPNGIVQVYKNGIAKEQ